MFVAFVRLHEPYARISLYNRQSIHIFQKSPVTLLPFFCMCVPCATQPQKKRAENIIFKVIRLVSIIVLCVCRIFLFTYATLCLQIEHIRQYTAIRKPRRQHLCSTFFNCNSSINQYKKKTLNSVSKNKAAKLVITLLILNLYHFILQTIKQISWNF